MSYIIGPQKANYQKRSNLSAFTLIELLVVIAIIGVLATVSVIYFNNSRMNARDAKRVADIQQVQLALKHYYADHGEYPQNLNFGGSLSSGATNYILRVPTNPTPRTDNDCPDEEYQYKVLEGGQRYSLVFCLGNRAADLKYAGKKTGTTNGILDCEPGYIPVVGSAEFNTNDFCVMQYEAKCISPSYGCGGPTPKNDDILCPCETSGAAVMSVPDELPIINVTPARAQTLCQSAGGHLMTNAEWMTIARDIEEIPENWIENVVNGYDILRGNAYETHGDLDQAFDDYSGSYGSDFRRYLYLSSGHQIWDLIGNAAEMLNNTCERGSGVGMYYEGPGWDIHWQDSELADYELGASGPKYYIGEEPYTRSMYRGCNEGQFVRGGDFSENDFSGLFALDFSIIDVPGGTSYAPSVGFRCVK